MSAASISDTFTNGLIKSGELIDPDARRSTAVREGLRRRDGEADGHGFAMLTFEDRTERRPLGGRATAISLGLAGAQPTILVVDRFQTTQHYLLGL